MTATATLTSNLHAELTEQARIIGMSGEREARLLARVEELYALDKAIDPAMKGQ